MTDSSGEPIRAVDLFCGAGGLSWGLVEALKKVAVDHADPTEAVLEDCIDLVGVNHWERAIETYERNHPWARHFHDDIAHVDPREVFPGRDPGVTILSGGIECTHWSSARGGKPVDDQKRMPAWDFLTWAQKLRPDHILVENVPEFQSWGPIDDEGQPTRNGETFEQWVNSLHALGYSVDWQVLNAADYGDATSRERFFLMATRDGAPEFPAPSHSEDGAGDTEPYRTAADIIDWSDPGGSIWTRDIENPRVRPLKNSTMQRIAEGIRRHCDDRLEPLADALGDIGRQDVKRLREQPVPAHLAGAAAEALDEPFLVEVPGPEPTATPFLAKYYGTSTVRPVDTPLDTVTSGGHKFGLCTPSLLGQHSNSVARDVRARPTPMVATGGKLQLVNPAAYLLRQQSDGVPPHPEQPLPTISGAGAIAKVEAECALVKPRNGLQGGLHRNSLYRPEDRPLHVVTAKNHDGPLVMPSLVRYSHGGASLGVDRPMPTIATEKGGVFALSAPYLCLLCNGRAGQRPRTRDVERPLMTAPASKVPAGLATPDVVPFIDDYEGRARGLDEPLGTATSRDRFALVVPERYPWGLDVRYRMLQPRELARAQGFPDDYEFAGTKTDTTEQIGNAVPVNLAQSLVESLLESELPALTDYLDDEPATTPVPDAVGRQGVADDD